MIKINEIPLATSELYSPEGELIGEINEIQLYDIQLQIKKAALSGYYLKYKGQKIRIDHFGALEDYPLGLQDTVKFLLIEFSIT